MASMLLYKHQQTVVLRFSTTKELFPLLTLSEHAREGLVSVILSVCLCVTFLFWRRRPFQV